MDSRTLTYDLRMSSTPQSVDPACPALPARGSWWFWPAIAVGVVLWLGMNGGWFVPGDAEPTAPAAPDDGNDSSGELLPDAARPLPMDAEITARLMVGFEEIGGPQFSAAVGGAVGAKLEHDHTASVDDLCASAILDAYLHHAEEANSSLASAMERAGASGDPFLQARVDATARAVRGERLTEEEASALRSLGYFSLMAQALGPDTEAANRQLRESGMRSAIAILLTLLWYGAAGLSGFILLIVIGIRLARRPPLPPSASPRLRFLLGESFAIYLVGFGLLSLIGAWTFRAASDLSGVELPAEPQPMGGVDFVLQIGIMILPLALLFWPVIRRERPGDVLRAVGLHRGAGVWRECVAGVATYCMMLPLVGVGMIAFAILNALFGDEGTLPSHDIIDILKQGGSSVIMILVIAAVVAPLVEEVFFRGAFFDSLRARWHGFGRAGAFFAAALVSSAIFAGIHQQGLLFAPVLMGTAGALCIARAWRGSLIACVVAHGINNGFTVLLNVMLWS